MKARFMTRITSLVATAVLFAAISAAVGAPITDGLVLWLDSNDQSTITNLGGSVTQWDDKSTAGNHATASDGQTPTHSAGTGPNGTDELTFDGSDRLVAGDVIPRDTSTTIFFVLDRPDTSGRGGVVQRDPGSPYAGVFLAQGNGSNMYLIAEDNDSDRVVVTGSVKSGLQMWQGTVDFDADDKSATVRLFGDGALVASKTGNIDGIGNDESDELELMSRDDRDTIDGDMGEVLVFDRAINSAERIVTQNYLSSKFDLPLDASDVYAGDTAANANFDHDVFGVGTSDSDTIVSATSTGEGITLNAPGLTDGEFILAGFENDNDFTQSTFFLDTTDLDGDETLDITFDTSVLGLSGTELLAFNDTDPDALNSLTSGALSGNELTFSLSGDDVQDGFYGVVIPEPATLALLLLGGVALLNRRPRHRRRNR